MIRSHLLPSAYPSTLSAPLLFVLAMLLRHCHLSVASSLSQVLETINQDLYQFEDVQEFLDLFGVLPDVLSENESVEEFMSKLKK